MPFTRRTGSFRKRKQPMIRKPAKRYQSLLCRMCPICISWILAISYDKPFVLFWGKVGSDCTRLFLGIVAKCIKSNNNAIKDESYFTLYKPKIHPTLHYFWRLKNLSTYWVDINFEHNTKNWQQPYYLWLNIIRDNIIELSLPCVFLYDYL